MGRTLVSVEAEQQVVSAAWLVFTPYGRRRPMGWIDADSLARPRNLSSPGRSTRQLAVAHGVRYLQVDAPDNSKPILLRLGFEAVTTTTPYVWDPGKTRPTSLGPGQT